MSTELAAALPGPGRLPEKTDLVGLVVGDLTVVSALPRQSPNGSRLWLCACSCGQGKAIRASGSLMYAFRRALPMACASCNGETRRGSWHAQRAAFHSSLLGLYAKEGTLYGRDFDERTMLEIGDEVASQLDEDPFVENNLPRDLKALKIPTWIGESTWGRAPEAGFSSQDWSRLFPKQLADHKFECASPGCGAYEERGWVCVDCAVFLCRVCVEKKEAHRHGSGTCENIAKSFDSVEPSLRRVPVRKKREKRKTKSRDDFRLVQAPYGGTKLARERGGTKVQSVRLAPEQRDESACAAKGCALSASHWIEWDAWHGGSFVPVKARFCAHHSQKLLDTRIGKEWR